MIQINTTALTQALIRCPSVTPHEGGALALLEQILARMGFVCHRMTFEAPGTPPVENLYARFGNSKPNLCFAGHTDVVPPGDDGAWQHGPFEGEIHDGLLYGRGAVDMKGAIAAFVVAASRYIGEHRGSPPGSISLLITGDEEGPSINGTIKVLDWLAQRGERLDAAIVGEPTNPSRLGDEIKIGRRGSVNCELVVFGKQGHAAYPQLAENPIHKLIAVLDRLATESLDAGTEHFQPSSLQITVISVPNTAVNVIPSEARAKFNIRYNDLWTRPRLEERINTIISEAARAVGARYDIAFHGTGDVFRTDPGLLVAALSDVVAAKTGMRPKLTTSGGTSDARFIHSHCPVIEFGLVNQTMHKVDEAVAINDLEQLTDIYHAFLQRYFAM